MPSNALHQHATHSPSFVISSGRVDVISDSEPERVETRRGLNGDRRVWNMEGIAAQAPLADEGCNEEIPATRLPTSNGVISVHDLDDASAPESIIPLQQVHEPDRVHTAPRKRAEKSDPSMSSMRFSTLHGSPKTTRGINFNEFAYDGSRPGHLGSFRMSRSLSRSGSVSTPTAAAVLPSLSQKPSLAPRKKGRAGTQPTYSFTDQQWTQLHVCVCCDEKWTARKSVKGKIAHLKSCAKDAFMSDELVEKKILEEVRNPSTLPEPRKGVSTKRTVSASVSTSTVILSRPGTLLEDVVNEIGASKKKARRPVAAAVSVKGAPDTREAIRQKAQMFLEPNVRVHTSEPATRRIADEEDMDLGFHIPPTQILPPSRLASRSAPTPISGVFPGHDISPPKPPQHIRSTLGLALQRMELPGSSDSNESENTIGSDDNLPQFRHSPVDGDASNVAGPSKINWFFPSSKRSGISKSKPFSKSMSKRAGSSVVISLLSSDDSGSSSDLSLLHLSEKGGKPVAGTPPLFQIPSRSQSGSPARPEALVFNVGPGNDEWGRDACLQWDGVDDLGVSDSSSVPGMSSSPRTNKKTKSPSPSRKGKARAVGTSQKRRNKPVKEEANLMPLFDEAAVNEHLKTMITSNEELYLRVLRYEPINFEVFYDLTLAHKLQPRGLRLKLRNFLDSQNIAFQTSVAAAKARRRH